MGGAKMRRKKVGTITLAIGLIVFGLGLLFNNFTDIQLTDLYKYWPVLLIGVGLEMFVYVLIYRRNEQVKLSLDSLCILLILAAALFANHPGDAGSIGRLISGPINKIQENMTIDGILYKDLLKETVIRENISKDFDIHKVSVKNSFGDINVLPSDSRSVKVEAIMNIKYNDEKAAREYLKDVVKIVEGSDTKIYVEEYNGTNRQKFSKAVVDFIIYVPKAAYAEATSSFGDIVVQEVGQGINLTNQHGDITVKDIGGEAILKNSFGNVEVKNIGGNLKIRNEQGDIDAGFIAGSADIETSFGAMDVQEIGGKLTAKNNSGTITAKEIKGDADVRTSFGDIHASSISGNAVINGNNGSIQARELLGNVQIRNAFGDIQYHSSNTDNGDIYAKTSFGDVDTSLPILVTKGINEQTAQGKTGNGSCKIELITNNGSIEIK
jgi:hypothetical protein